MIPQNYVPSSKGQSDSRYGTPPLGNTALPFTTNTIDIAGLCQLNIDYSTAWSKVPRFDVCYINTVHSVGTNGVAQYQAYLIMRDIDPKTGQYAVDEKKYGYGIKGQTVQEALLRLLELLSDIRKKQKE